MHVLSSARWAVVAGGLLIGTGLGTAFPAFALTGNAESTVTKALMESCIKSMKANQNGSGLTDAKINGYCSCVGMKTAGELQIGEVQRYFNSGGQGTVRMRDMNARVGRECSGRYLR